MGSGWGGGGRSRRSNGRSGSSHGGVGCSLLVLTRQQVPTRRLQHIILLGCC